MGTTTPSSDQIADLKADIGDVNDAFSDPEITRIWSRVSGASDANSQHEAALALMARQLMTNAAKLHDFSVAGDSNKASQIFKNMKALYETFKPSLESALGTNQSVARGGLRAVPRQGREKPDA